MIEIAIELKSQAEIPSPWSLKLSEPNGFCFVEFVWIKVSNIVCKYKLLSFKVYICNDGFAVLSCLESELLQICFGHFISRGYHFSGCSQHIAQQTHQRLFLLLLFLLTSPS